MTFNALVANGEILDYPYIATRLKQARQIIAVDGGLIHCDKMQITPDLLIGDFDSCPPDLLLRYAELPTQRFPQEKDQTDLEIALKSCIAGSPLPIYLFGALNKRLDHSLYNLHLLSRYPKKVYIQSDWETVFAFTDHTAIETSPGQTLSLIPLNGKAEGVTTKGLRWELQDAAFDSHMMSISNVAVKNRVEISIKKGSLLLIQPR